MCVRLPPRLSLPKRSWQQMYYVQLQHWTGSGGLPRLGVGVAGPNLSVPWPPWTQLPQAWYAMRVRLPQRLSLPTRSWQEMYYKQLQYWTGFGGLPRQGAGVAGPNLSVPWPGWGRGCVAASVPLFSTCAGLSDRTQRPQALY